jgi:hypothetical protein
MVAELFAPFFGAVAAASAAASLSVIKHTEMVAADFPARFASTLCSSSLTTVYKEKKSENLENQIKIKIKLLAFCCVIGSAERP